MLFDATEVTSGTKSNQDLALPSGGQGEQGPSENWDWEQSVRPSGDTVIPAWTPAPQSGQGREAVKWGKGQVYNNAIGYSC